MDRLNRSLTVTWQDPLQMAQAARTSLQNAARIEVPDRWFVVLFVAGYLFVLVPLNWLLFRLLPAQAARSISAWMERKLRTTNAAYKLVWHLAEAEAALAAARELGLALPRGVMAGLLGPSYETPAEIRMLARLGADVVGVSSAQRLSEIAAQLRPLFDGEFSVSFNLAPPLFSKPFAAVS